MSEANEVKADEKPEYLSPFIPDGFTLKAKIPAVPGRWSEINFRYRPMSPDEESEVWAKSRLYPSEPMTAFYAPIMATKILGWDVKDRDGKPVKIEEGVFRKHLPPALYDLFKQHVDGSLAGEQEKN